MMNGGALLPRSSAPSFVESGQGAGSPAIFLHGIGGGADSWHYQLERLSARRRSLAWWMPGYGPSAPIADMTFDRLASSVVDLLDSEGIAKAHIVGHSIGGMIALQLAGIAQHRICSLTLSATSPAFGNPNGTFQRSFLEKRLKPLERGFDMTAMAPKIVDELVGTGADPNAIALAIKSMSVVPVSAYRAAMRCVVGFDARPILPTIAVPTLVIAGSEDSNAPVGMMRRMAEKIPGSRFTIIEGAGHLANMEKPREFNRALTAFLDDVNSNHQ